MRVEEYEGDQNEDDLSYTLLCITSLVGGWRKEEAEEYERDLEGEL